MNYESLVENRFRGGEWLDALKTPTYVFRDWFFEMYLELTNEPVAHLSFDFNFEKQDREAYARAKLSGLLPFHFFSKIALKIREEFQLDFEFFESPKFHTNFQLRSSNLEDLLTGIDKLRKENVFIMEQALIALQSLKEQYDLSAPRE